MTAQMHRNGQPPVLLRRASKDSAAIPPDAAPSIPHRRTTTQTPVIHKVPVKRPARQVETETLPCPQHATISSFVREHWFSLVAGMAVMLLFYCGSTMYVLPFVAEVNDHWTYGDARMTQYDANVGHGGSSHFLAEYWHGRIVVIEFPGGNVNHAQVYTLLMTSTTDQTHRSVTLSVRSVNPHGSPGKPDLVVSVTGFSASVVFYNTGNAFQTQAS